MSYKDTPPKKAAEEFVAAGVTIEECEKLQVERKARIKTFKTFKAKVLIAESEKLFAYGEQVLTHMKILLKNTVLITLVEVVKSNAWSKKGYVFPVIPYEDSESKTKRAKEKDKQYWRTVMGDYSNFPIGFKTAGVKSPYILLKKNVRVLGSYTVKRSLKK